MIDFVDASLGAIVSKLKTKGLYNDTLIVVGSKHGNAPINPALFGEVNPAQITNATGVPVEWQTVHIPDQSQTVPERCHLLQGFRDLIPKNTGIWYPNDCAQWLIKRLLV